MKISVKAAIDAYGMTKGIVRYTAYCLILIASLWLSSCNKSNPAQTEETIITTELKLTEDQEKSYGITFGSPQVRMVYDAVALGGVVEAPPQQTASVSFPLAGNVRSIHVLAGNQVQKGTTLALIESIELIQLQEDYWKTLGQLTFAEQERERQTALNQQDIGAKYKLQQAEADVRVLEAAKYGLEAKLQIVGIDIKTLKINQIIRQVALRSPILGIIKNVHATIGMSIKSGESLFEIINQTGARLVLKVFEKDLDRIKIGQKVTFANGTAIITSLGSNFDPNSRTVDVYAQLNGIRILAGQYINAKVETTPRHAETLPETAIVRTGEIAHVFIKNAKGIFEPIIVKTGTNQNGFVEVIFVQKLKSLVVIAGAQILQAELTKAEGGEEE